MSQWGAFLLSIIRYSTLLTMRWLALVGVPALFYCHLISTTTYRFQGPHPPPNEFSFFNLSLLLATSWMNEVCNWSGDSTVVDGYNVSKDTSASVARIPR
jgi:hypothetical protein